MMSAVGLLSSAGPWEAGTKGVPVDARLTALAARHCPAVLRAVAAALVGVLRFVLTRGPVTRWVDGMLAAARKEEEQQKMAEGDTGKPTGVAENPEAGKRTPLIRILFEGFAQGAAGFVQEAQLLTKNWGLHLEEITYGPIWIWHGTKDTRAPVAQIRYLAKRLPHSTLREFDGDGHFSVVSHLDEFVSELIPEETKRTQ